MPRPTKKIKLSKAEERFCQEYIVDLNGTQAYIRAGHKVSASTARVSACRLLTNDNIQARMRELIFDRSKRTEITADKVIKELGRVAFSDMKEYATWDSNRVHLISSDGLTKDQAAAVESVKETRLSGISIKLFNKLSALEMLSKHFGLFVEPPPIDITLKVIGAPQPEVIIKDNPNAGINGADNED